MRSPPVVVTVPPLPDVIVTVDPADVVDVEGSPVDDVEGSVVAVAVVSHLVARDGILERLRAQGFIIADPSKPLEE